MKARDEVEAAVRKVIEAKRSSYFLRHEVGNPKAFEATVAELMSELIWPVLREWVPACEDCGVWAVPSDELFPESM